MWDVRKRSTVKPLHPERTRRPSGAARWPTKPPSPSFGSIALTASALALGGLLHALPAQAIEFGDGEFQGSLDTTISHGLTFRVGKHDPEYSEEVNGNDGDLNYDRGLVSNTSKFTTDLDLQYGDFGAFVRASGFIDFENENGRRPHVELSEAAKDRVGKHLELLDAYVTGAFDAGDAAVDLRLGKHVLNWGESTFIPNGINAINPFDVSKLRLPGSELREALLPISMASLAVAPTDTVSIEGFYQFDWEKTEIDPVGSYFSTTDYVGPGARRVFIDDPRLRPSLAATGRVLGADPDFMDVKRESDREPRDSGQWGVAMRYLVEELNSTEFGLYYVNYHSRLPMLGVHTGTEAGVTNGLLAFGNAVSPTGPYAQVIAQLTQLFLAQGVSPEDALARAAGVVGRPDAIDAYADTGNYFVEYPEDLQLFGLSFNTQLGTSGWALQGEYSFRPDVPLQIEEEKLIELGLAPIIACLTTGAPLLATQPLMNAIAACRQAASRFGLGADIVGYTRRDVSQFQVTATKVFGPALGADGVVFLTEAALMHVHDMPEKSTLPLESPADGPFPADATSFGYRMAMRLDYNNAVGGVNLFPYAQWQHDVNGNSPSPIGPFVDDRTALTLGVGADYLSRWQATLGYTRYTGRRNELSDRDFISASVKYSF